MITRYNVPLKLALGMNKIEVTAINFAGMSLTRSLRETAWSSRAPNAPTSTPQDNLLDVLEDCQFTIREVNQTIQARQRPFILITSNPKRELSDPFLRRCYCHHIAFPTPEQMREIVKLHFPDLDKGFLDAALGIFYELRQKGFEKPPATSELLNWLGALQHAKITPERLNVPYVGTLLKRTEDILAWRGGAKRLKVH